MRADALVGTLLACVLAWSLPAQVSAGEAPSEAPELPSEPSEPLLPAVQDAWLPGAGERSPATTLQPPHFLGMTYMFPLRLHLARGGHIDGALGGVDPEAGELLLVLPERAFTVDLSLVGAVTPLSRLPETGSEAAAAKPPGMLTAAHVEYRWRPSWRSGLGLLMSFVLPGSGQWIQQDRQELGFLFLSGAALFVGSGLLALYGPSTADPEARRVLAGVLFGLAGTVSIVSGAHAFTAGRVRVAVEVDPRRSSAP